MASCALSGLALLAVSWFLPRLRPQIIGDLPDSVRKGAKAAIGSLLAKEAIHLYRATLDSGQLDEPFALASISIGVLVIGIFYFLKTKYQPPADDSKNVSIGFLLNTEFIAVVAGMWVVLRWFRPHYFDLLPAKTTFSYLWVDKLQVSIFCMVFRPVS